MRHAGRPRIKLGKQKAEALKRDQQIRAKPKQRAVISNDSLLAFIDAFLTGAKNTGRRLHTNGIILV